VGITRTSPCRSTAVSGVVHHEGYPLYLGAWGNGNPTYGMLDEVRISNTARYRQDFTPPAGPFVADAFTDPAETPEEVMIKADDRRLMDDLIAGLPVAFREIVVLRELEELSYKEIAEIAGVPIGTVMSRLARARGLLQKAWRDRNAG